MRARILQNAYQKLAKKKSPQVNKIVSALKKQLSKANIKADISQRRKSLYTIYETMKLDSITLAEADNGFAFKVIVKSLDECYRTLGLIHNLYKPVPGNFKDYIAIPKDNGYQSLHTILFGPQAVPVEVQIRTREMDLMAENGIVSHWLSVQKGGSHEEARLKAEGWARSLLELQKNAISSLEFVDSVKKDLLPDKVFIFTPNGKIIELLNGSTVIDFAYAVHTDIGNTCIAAKIDRKLAPLSTVLRSGQTVQVVTAPGARPNPAWLNYVVTGKARSSIRHYIKNQKQSEAVAFGQRLLDRALKRYQLSRKQLSLQAIESVIAHLNVDSEEAMLQEIGLGQRSALLIAYHLANEIKHHSDGGEVLKPGQPLMVKGTEGMVIDYAECCYPIPGDPIVGYIQEGRGIIIHRDTCSLHTQSKRDDNSILVQWEDHPDGDFKVAVNVTLINKPGTFAELATVISQMDSNIESISTEDLDGECSYFKIVLNIKDCEHLAKVMRKIQAINDVSKLTRYLK